jgi:putative transposase
VLEVLHSERFVDVSPEETWATLLDEGTYLCSTRTMYRILAAHHGRVRERRNQLTHPPYAKPELLAERPNELWSWDISKLKGPAKWTWFYLYVIIDVFSRHIVGWTVQHREDRADRHGADRAGRRAAADHSEDPDAARRPRRPDALQAAGVPARRPRHHENA